IIHLGHNRSVKEVVQAAIQEDVQGIAISSYQGGHIEYFQYMIDLLKENDASHICVFGGGGGTIIPKEVRHLHTYGVTRLFTPEDGRKLGLQGMINVILEASDFTTPYDKGSDIEKLKQGDRRALARFITAYERGDILQEEVEKYFPLTDHPTPVLGITGTGGAGKSSLTDELIRRFLHELDDKKVAIISIDPTKRKTGGALLG